MGLPRGRSHCEQCGQRLEPASGRCGQCDPVSPSNPGIAGERRQITVVFCDLVGSTLLAEELDPEELRDVVRAYQQTCAAVVERFDGHIAQYLGDGLLIYFGFPNAHEEDPTRALRAGLDIVRAITKFEFRRSDGSKTKLFVRVGIHTGLVVAGEMGTRGRPERLALGATPNIAARLQTLAPKNSVVVSADTRRLTEGYFEFEELGERAQSGSQNIVGFRVLRTSDVQTRFELAVARGLTPFQNRESEHETLRQRWLRATEGQGGLAFISGEAGIGKSRLVHQLQRALESDGALWLVGRGSPFKRDDAFWPLAEALRQLLDGPRDAADPGWTPLLESRLAELELGSNAGASLAALAALLGVRVNPNRASSFTSSPRRGRQTMLDVAILLLLRAAQVRPLTLCFEDLHWADPSTLEFLNELAHHLERARVLVVLTARPSFVHSWPPGTPLCSISLVPLAAREVHAIVDHVCVQSSLPDGVKGQIVARTDGVPLFVEELTKALIESGLEASSPARGDALPVAIPATLQDSLMARLDRLSRGKAIAQVAAVLGREFDAGLLAALGIFDSDALSAGIEQLLAADLVRPSENGAATMYAFKHALIQDVAYESLLRSDRRDYHRKIAEVLLEKFAEVVEHQPELVAHHFTEAAQPGDALEYWLRAAQHSIDRGANAEATHYLERARAGAAELPDAPQRWECELQVEMHWAQVARATAGYASSEMEDAYLRALGLCHRLGAAPGGAVGTQMLVARVRCGEDFLTKSLAQNPRVGNRLFWIMWGFGAYHQSRAQLQRALDIGTQLVELAQGEPVLALEGHFGAGSTCYFMGRLTEARTHLERGWECFETLDRIAETSPTGHHAEVLCAGYLCLCLWQLGFPEEAELQSRRAIDVANAANHSYSVAYALTIAAWLAQMNGDRSRAAARVAEAEALATRFGFSFALAWLTPVALWLESADDAEGAPTDTAERFGKHLEEYRRSGYRVATTYFFGLWAEVLITHGQLAKADEVLLSGLADAEAGGERFWQPELYRLQAEVLLSQPSPDFAAAKNKLVSALALAKQIGSRAHELRAATSLAKLQ